jgi:hypothetical protein
LRAMGSFGAVRSTQWSPVKQHQNRARAVIDSASHALQLGANRQHRDFAVPNNVFRHAAQEKLRKT